MAKFQKPLAQLLLKCGDEILDCVRDARGVEVEDVRRRVLGPWRAYVDALGAPSTSQTRPMPPGTGANGPAAGS